MQKILLLFSFVVSASASISLGRSSCAILDGREVRCWGKLTDDLSVGDASGEMGVNIPIIDLGTESSPQSIHNGNSVTCVVFTNRRVKCWGVPPALGYENTESIDYDDPAQMGDNLPFVDLGTEVQVEQMSMGDSHACVLTTTGQVKCWGENGSGQLGYGDTKFYGVTAGDMGDNLPFVDLGGVSATQVSCGGSHTCAVLDTGDLKCWGRNFQGQLGLGDSQNRGDAPGAMGTNLPIVDLGSGLTVQQVITGQLSSCALLSNGALKCWGYNDDGNLGYEDTTQRGTSQSDMGDNLPRVEYGGGVIVHVTMSLDQTCVMLAGSAGVKCWGFGFSGVLGQESTASIGDAPGTMESALNAIDFGTSRQVIDIDVTSSHACAIFEVDYSLKCWGFNADGQLGLGDTENRGDEVNEMGTDLPFVDIGAGRSMFDGATIAPTPEPTLEIPTKEPTRQPTPQPSTLPPVGSETFALGGFRDPADILIECDTTWSYKETGGSSVTQYFPDSDNCLSISDPNTLPFFKSTFPEQDFAPDDPDVQAAVPAGYQLLPDRWCSIKQNPDVCGANSNSLYRPDADTAQGTCLVGEVRRGWAYCVRAINAVPTISPTVQPTAVETGEREGIGGFYDTFQQCDTDWKYVVSQSTGELASPGADNCMDIDEYPPIDSDNPDFPPSDPTIQAQLSGGQFLSGARWCSVAQEACNKNNANYNPVTQTSTDRCTATEVRQSWVFCVYNTTGDETAFPTAAPTPVDYPLAIGGYIDPSGEPVACDTDAGYKIFPSDIAVDADADGTFPFNPDFGRVPFINENNLDYFDPEETATAATSIPPGSYISTTKWCSIRTTVCNGQSTSVYTQQATDDNECPAAAGEQRRAWGFAVLPGANPETEAPTPPPSPTAAPTVPPEIFPRAVQGFTASAGRGVACDKDWFFRTESGATLIPADVDGCLSLEDSATQPFRWTTPDHPQNLAAIGVVEDGYEVDYTRWCSHKQTTYSTGQNFYTNETDDASGTADTPSQLKKAWGYCFKEILVPIPTAYPTAYPTSSGGSEGETSTADVESFNVAIYASAGALGVLALGGITYYYNRPLIPRPGSQTQILQRASNAFRI